MTVPPATPEITMRMAQNRDALALALGRFCIDFAYMEDALNRTIHALLELEDNAGYALTSAVFNLSTRLDMLTTLAREMPMADSHRAVVQENIAKAIDLNSDRNWFLHDPWTAIIFRVGDPKPHHFKQRMRPKGSGREWQKRELQTDNIDALAQECLEVAAALRDVAESHRMDRIFEKNAQKF